MGHDGWDLDAAAPRHRDGGWTLVELLIAMSLLGIVLSMVGTALAVTQTGVVRAQDRSTASDQLRLAIGDISHGARIARMLQISTWPNGDTPGMYMWGATSLGGVDRCVGWRVWGDELQRRDWRPDWRSGGLGTTWRTIAEHVVNRDPPEGGGPVRAFTADGTLGGEWTGAPWLNYGTIHEVHVVIMVNVRDTAGSTMRAEVRLTARNVSVGFHETGDGRTYSSARPIACEDAPAW